MGALFRPTLRRAPFPPVRPTRAPTRKTNARSRGGKGALRRVGLNRAEGENVRGVTRGQSDGIETTAGMMKNGVGEARHINCSGYFLFHHSKYNYVYHPSFKV